MMPQSTCIEKVVLATAMTNPNLIDDIIDLMQESYFYSSIHKKVFNCIETLYSRGTGIDIVTLAEEMRTQKCLKDCGGELFLCELTESISSVSKIEGHVNILKNKATLRDIIVSSTEILGKAYEPDVNVGNLIDFSEKKTIGFSEETYASKISNVKDILPGTLENIERRSRDEIKGIITGFPSLDRMIYGFEGGQLTVIAGRPSMGKTALALNFALNAIKLMQTHVLIFSIEMSKEQLVRRCMASEAKISMGRLRSGKLTHDDWTQLNSTVSSLVNYPLYIDDDTNTTISSIKSKTRRMYKQENIGMVIIDYLQLMKLEGGDDVSTSEKTGSITRGLKQISKELNIPVIALSQLSRQTENRPDPRPKMSDLRNSGEIEQDADIIIFPFREEVYKNDLELKGVAELIVAKQRDGSTGKVPAKFSFQGQYSLFEEVAEGPYDSF